jgi:hypothetical protein
LKGSKPGTEPCRANPSTEFEFRIRERRRATARRRFSAWMSRAHRVRAHFFVIVSGVSCAGRRLACAPTVGIAKKRFADIKSTFPLFRRRDVLRSLSAEGGGKILPQTRTRASRRKSITSCQGQVQVKPRLSQPGPRRPGPRGTSWASQVLRRTVVTRGGRRCSQSASSTLEFSFKCRRRRLVGRGPRLYRRGHLLLASTPIKYTHAGPRLARSAWSNFRPTVERAHSFGVARACVRREQ